jgi:hypothetical protein
VAEQPEPMAPALVQLQEILKGELNERAATPEVTQGKTPEGVTGWQSIQLLQQAAQSRFGFSIQWTADMVYRLSQFLLHSLVTQLDTQNLLKVDSRYPTWIVDAIRAKAQAWYTDGGTIDIDVSVSSGTGMIKARKNAEAVGAAENRPIRSRTSRRFRWRHLASASGRTTSRRSSGISSSCRRWR